MCKRFFTHGLLLAALTLAATPTLAASPATRSLDDLLNYRLHGVSLAMSVAEACRTLEKGGFKADDPDTPAAERLFWTYRRDKVVVGLQRLAGDDTLLVNITATRLPDEGGEVDIGAEAERIMASWGPASNDEEDPVCITREGAVKGKPLFGRCVVRSSDRKAAAYQATIVRNQSVEILTHAAPARN